VGLKPDELAAVVNELSRRPGHEKVRTLVYELLVRGLDVPSTDIDFETPLPEVRGRTDALLGYTVFEFKRNLKEEMAAVEEKLPQYLADREKKTGQRFIGIATDGANFLPYRLRAGQLDALSPYKTSRDKPEELVTWLASVVSLQAQLAPTPLLVSRELGRESLAYQVARSQLTELWDEVKAHPDVTIKRELWAKFLHIVYGSSVDNEDDLFLQHTYLTVVAKTMATTVVGIALPDPEQLLPGEPFQAVGIFGAVESDFFDWVLTAKDGPGWVRRVCRQVSRFKLENVQHDVLKGLYESLIDPEQRHDLGEYYTPDWLAEKMCDRVIAKPQEQRVLDPACGSGTFLFHAVRRVLKAATDSGLSNGDALALCTKKVLGVDIHPVAVIIARVTYLLAIGDRLRGDRPSLSIPVYLGDSLQWNARDIVGSRPVAIEVPKGPTLEFPSSVTENPGLFDQVVETMLDLSAKAAPPGAMRGWLDREKVGDPADRTLLVETYQRIAELRQKGKNHIWGYVARNLARPIWLSSEPERADLVLGNPPWLAYHYMSNDMQKQFRRDSKRLGVWAGGKVATHQDLSGYFFARSAELYTRVGGTVAFVMPYAAMSRQQFEGFRTGKYSADHPYAQVRFREAWAFDDSVQPLFRVPSCVLIAEHTTPGALPPTVTAYHGRLPRRDATLAEAEHALTSEQAPWPSAWQTEGLSPYETRFHQGATLIPRMLALVDPVAAGKLGVDIAAPRIVSHRSHQEKKPWRDLPPLAGQVEAEFLRPAYLGESVAPFRLLSPVLAVVPWTGVNGAQLLNAGSAGNQGYVHLADWLQKAEKRWNKNSRGNMTFIEQIDYYGKLSAQLPPAMIRVLYSASGSLPTATVLRDSQAVVEHGVYWLEAETIEEAEYLVAILNSEAARGMVAGLQARGQWGARHFDKVMFQLPIPTFDPNNAVHRQLVDAARQAEAVAASVAIPKGHPFVAARQIIRRALAKDGIDGTINALVEELLKARVQTVAP
jgi:N-6 DNA Methylase